MPDQPCVKYIIPVFVMFGMEVLLGIGAGVFLLVVHENNYRSKQPKRTTIAELDLRKRG